MSAGTHPSPTANAEAKLAALRADPSQPQRWVEYVNALIEASNFQQAHQAIALARQRGLREDLAATLESAVALRETAAAQAGRREAASRQDLSHLVVLFKAGRLDELIRAAQTVLKNQPGLVAAWILLGAALKA